MKILPTIIVASITLSVVQTSSTMSPDKSDVHLSDQVPVPAKSQHLDADGAGLFAMLTPTLARAFQPRQLSLEDRVAYQRAIEEVYRRNRIWPKENRGVKPSLDKLMPQATIEKKVKDYLRNSQLLEQDWQKAITPEQLQAEMDRMAQNTRQPGVLREIFAALGNDPAIIAECLARPALAQRLLAQVNAHQRDPKANASARKPSVNGSGLTLAWLHEPLVALRGGGETRAPRLLAAAKATRYKLPAITDTSSGCAANWTATTLTGAPDPRYYHTAVWTGSEMIIWGGEGTTFPSGYNNGGRYDPATDSWTATSTTNAPGVRANHTAVWTGSEMIIWGGDYYNFWNTGGRYNPGTDTWTATATANAPDPRSQHTAVWTSSEMIVWGGYLLHCCNYDTGGRYDPDTDTWTATSTTNAPSGRGDHTAVWTGSEMIVWGGDSGDNSGGRYNPATNSWTPTSTNGPSAHRFHTAIWTGNRMIVWGGTENPGYYGATYDPQTDSWTPTSAINAPTQRSSHTAVWTGSNMIVWGGYSSALGFLNTGGTYDPVIDIWTVTATNNAPEARYLHRAVWTGDEMIAWGGVGLNTGGRYSGQVPLPAAVSRKNHGGTDRDLSLTYGGTPRIECRSGGGSNVYQLVMTFANAVTFNPASVTLGNGTVTTTSGSGTDTATIDLTVVTNQQTINVTLFTVTDDCGTRDITIPMRVLVGDVTGNGVVSNTDVAAVKGQVGAPVTSINFLNDVNANGIISNTDVAAVKAQVGTTLP
jgi:N-acetylneuraminic acid mutarotase